MENGDGAAGGPARPAADQGATAPLAPEAALQVLNDLHHRQRLRDGAREEGGAAVDALPPELCEEFERSGALVNELLRHYWRAFPAATPVLREKAGRVHPALNAWARSRLSTTTRRVEQRIPSSPGVESAAEAAARNARRAASAPSRQRPTV